MISRRRFLAGTSLSVILAGLPRQASAWSPHGSANGTPIYSQAMGATDSSGFVISFPLSPTAASLPSTVLSASGSIGVAGANQYTVGSIFAGTIAVGQTLFSTAGVLYGQVLSLVSGGGQTGGSVWQLDTSTGGATLTGLSITAAPGPRQIWCDTANGSVTYNGLSPYPGYQLNGTGPCFQSGATGPGTPNSVYGPLPTFASAFYYLTTRAKNFFGVGDQIFLANGQTFNEGGAIFNATFNGTTTMVVNSVSYGYVEAGLWLVQGGPTNQQIKSQVTPLLGGESAGGPGRYIMSGTVSAQTTVVTGAPTSNDFGAGINGIFGQSVQYPLCFQSYDNTGVVGSPPTAKNALNLSTQGRAGHTTGTTRPSILCDPPPFTALGSTGGVSSTAIAISSLQGGFPTSRGGQSLSINGVVQPGVFTTTVSATVINTNIPVTIPANTPISLTGTGYGSSQLFTNGQALNPQVGGQIAGNWVFRGITYTGSYLYGNGPNFAGGNPYNILFENCTFPYAGCGIGGPSGNGANNSRNGIIRKCGTSQDALNNPSGHGASAFGYGSADGIVIEDCVVWRGGWQPGALDRQEAFINSASLNTSGVLTLNSTIFGTPGVGQLVTVGSVQGYVVSGSGSSWQLTVTGSTVTNQQCIFQNGYCPTIFDHGIYGAIGATDTPLVRRTVLVDCSATGFSARGSANCYNCVFIDNPTPTFTGGDENGNGYTVASFTASFSGSTMTVTAMASPQPFVGNLIVPGQSCGLQGAGLSNASFHAVGSGTNLTATSITGAVNLGDVILPLNGASLPGGIPAAPVIIESGGPSVYVTNIATTVNGTVTSMPFVVSQILPLIGGETLGGIGRYNLSSSQATLTGVACTTVSPGTAGESPNGANFNYHDNLVMGANDLNMTSGGFRHNGIGAQNGTPSSNIVRHLMINNGKYGVNNGIGTNVFVFTNAANYDIPCYVDFTQNAAYAFNDLLIQPNIQPVPNLLISTFGNNSLTAVSSGTYNSGTGVVTLTLAAAAPFSTGAVISVNLVATGINYPALQNAVYTTTSVSGVTVTFNIGANLSVSIGSGGTVGYSPQNGTNSINTWAISSGNYNDLTGVVTLTLATPVTFSVGVSIAIGSLTGASNIANVNSQVGVSSVASGTSVTFQAAAGLIGNSSATNAISSGNMSYSPATNAQIYASMQAQGYGDGTRNGLSAYMSANPDINWAYLLMQTAGPMCNNFPFVYS